MPDTAYSDPQNFRWDCSHNPLWLPWVVAAFNDWKAHCNINGRQIVLGELPTWWILPDAELGPIQAGSTNPAGGIWYTTFNTHNVGGSAWTDAERQQTVTHECGHMVLGTGVHSTNPADLMFSNPTAITVQPGDAARAVALYGAPVMPAPTVQQRSDYLDQLAANLAAFLSNGPMPLPPSPDGMQITYPTSSTITDASGAVWSFGGAGSGGVGQVVLHNGVQPAYAEGVIIGIKSGVIYVKNNQNAWFKWVNSAWVSTTNPF